MRLLINLIMLTCVAGLVSCQNSEDTTENDKFLIVTTTNILADGLKQIVGQHAEVRSLMGPGVDPHLYKPTHSDVESLYNADIIVYNGLHLEGKMQEILKKVALQKTVISAADGIPSKFLQNPGGPGTPADPHLWFNVALWKGALQHITNSLANTDSANSRFYTENFARYAVQLDSLHNWVQAEMSKIPEPQKVLVTAHDAFGYFGSAYQIEVRGLQGISTMSEYGIRDIQQMAEFISERKIPAVFVESSVPKKALEAVVEGCKQRGHTVVIGGSLYSDALGASDEKGGHYLGMVQHNVETIVNALTQTL